MAAKYPAATMPAISGTGGHTDRSRCCGWCGDSDADSGNEARDAASDGQGGDGDGDGNGDGDGDGDGGGGAGASGDGDGDGNSDVDSSVEEDADGDASLSSPGCVDPRPITATQATQVVFLVDGGSGGMTPFPTEERTRWEALRETFVGPEGLLSEYEHRVRVGFAIYATMPT